MADKIIKVGVVGTGRGASLACKAFSNPKCELAAMCDKNPDQIRWGRDLMDKYGGKGKQIAEFTDYDEMLRSDIDAVIVATDAIYHVPIVKKALNAGKHVLSEIPAINTVDEAYELKAAVRAHPELTYMAAENCCYWAFVEAWKKMREDGRFGEVVYAEGEYLHAMHPDEFAPSNYPEGHWRTTNPAIKYLTHELGPLLYIMDDRCVSVTCMEPDIIYNPHFPKKKANGVALFKTEKGAVIRILICFGAYASYDHNFRLFGTRGLIETDHMKMVSQAHSFANLYDVPGTFVKKIDIPVTEKSASGHGDGDDNMFNDFIESILHGTEPRLNIDKAIEMSLPGILAHESAMQGGVPIEIPKIL